MKDYKHYTCTECGSHQYTTKDNSDEHDEKTTKEPSTRRASYTRGSVSIDYDILLGDNDVRVGFSIARDRVASIGDRDSNRDSNPSPTYNFTNYIYNRL